MDLNNRYIYLPLLTISFSIIGLWILFQTEFLDLLSKISSIGTPLIALFAYWEYKSKTANKVNEEQLQTILNLLKDLRSYQYRILIRMNNRETPKKCGEYSLLQLSESYTPTKVKLSNELQKSSQKNPIDGDFKNLFVSGQFINDIIELSTYSLNPLIPKKIAQKLKDFTKYNEEENISSTEQAFYLEAVAYPTINKEEGTIKISNQKIPLYPLIELDSNYTFVDNTHPLSVCCEYYNKNFNLNYRPVYYSWEDLRKYLNELLNLIKEWLEDNNVKDVNLPDLDQTNAQSKES